MKKTILFTIIFATLFTTGCWDMVEINERIYPYSVGIDLTNETNGEGDLFRVTFSYPNIYALGKNPTQEETVYVVSVNGGSIFDATHNLTSSLQYPIYNKHLKVLAFSDAVARNPKYVKEIIDGLNRDFVINKMVKLVVTQGTAEELLYGKLKAKRQQAIEGVLYSTLINRQNTSMFTPRTLADFIEDIDRTGVSILPIATAKEDHVDIAGGGLFKDYKLIDYLDHIENRSIAIINNSVKEDGIETDFEGVGLSILATSLKTKKKLIDSEKLRIRLSTRIEGQIHEYTISTGGYEGIDNEEILHAMETVLANKVKSEIVSTIEKLQKEYQADAIYTSDFLSKYHPSVWEQVKDNWDETFSNVEFEVDVEVIIRRRGLTK